MLMQVIRILSFTILLSVYSLLLHAERTYFQQETNYTIDVRLDDENHILRGFETIEYINHSPDTLRYIFMHLWPNAYKNDRTAMCEQNVENNKLAFYYSSPNQKGFIDSLHFEVDELPVNVSNFNNHEDVQLLELLTPLAPGGKVKITTTFRVVIPSVFSRLGQDGKEYQMNQWYPKPAVYDAYGWHPMPYLEQGEFYSEFGSYSVRITIPKNYRVAATGELKTEEERQWMEQLIAHPDSIWPNQDGVKTILFEQDRIHDFAWFASTSYEIERTVGELPSGRKVNCYSYYKPENKKIYRKSSEVIAKTIAYFSKEIGEYPYAQATLVDGSTQEGAGGMEYPMITNIGHVRSLSELQTVIIHEVGHNWFYGMLGSNEREHPWLDEGINSFYEQKLDHELNRISKEEAGVQEDRYQRLSSKFNQNFIYFLARNKATDQPIETPSNQFTWFNYGAIIYAKAPYSLQYLEAYLGEEVFRKAMQQYFKEWQFKHPYPVDFQRVTEKQAGKKIPWFFEDLLKTNQVPEFKIRKVLQRNVFAHSVNDFHGPVPVSAWSKNKKVEQHWIEYPYALPAEFTCDSCDEYRIGFNETWSDADPVNNRYKVKGILHRYQPSLRLGLPMGIESKRLLSFLPYPGYNYYDGLQAGLLVHNLRIPNRPFQFAFAPAYAFGSKSLVGTAMVGYSVFPAKTFRQVDALVQVKTYHDQQSSLGVRDPVFARYWKISPSLRMESKPKTGRSTSRTVYTVRGYAIVNQPIEYALIPGSSPAAYQAKVGVYQLLRYGQLNVLHENKRTLNPFRYQADLHGNDRFLKLSITGNFTVDYHLPKRRLYVRAFAGKFFNLQPALSELSIRSNYLAATATGPNDYLYNETYLARNEQSGWRAQQVSVQEGGMAIRTAFLANPIGLNNNWLASINLRSDIPIRKKIPLQPFLDLATFHQAGLTNASGNKLLYAAGLELNLFQDFIIVQAPLLLSKDLKDYTQSTYSKNRFLQTVTFSLNFSKLNMLNSQWLFSNLMQ